MKLERGLAAPKMLLALIAGFAASMANAVASAGAVAAPRDVKAPKTREASRTVSAAGLSRTNWSIAEDRRRANKRRNVLRNRRAHRG